MSESATPQIVRDVVTWDHIMEMIEHLAGQLTGEYDVMLAITRGGMIPGAIIGYHIGLRNILVAAVQFYTDKAGERSHAPVFLQFPADPLLQGKRVLIVDEVWDSGKTIGAVIQRVEQAGGIPITAVLHYKPTASVIDRTPDHFVKETDAWIVYPWSAIDRE
jgi:uncharacterized protein